MQLFKEIHIVFSEFAKLLFAIDQFEKMNGRHFNLFQKSLTF